MRRRGFIALLAGSPAWAHHATVAEFDTTKRITLRGKMTRVEWQNPHVFLYVETKDGEWKLATNPPSFFQRAGVSRKELEGKIGQAVAIDAYPAKGGARTAYPLKMEFRDGLTLELTR